MGHQIFVTYKVGSEIFEIELTSPAQNPDDALHDVYNRYAIYFGSEMRIKRVNQCQMFPSQE